MARIAIGGFLHETNTFAPSKASFENFVTGGGFPRMLKGAEIAEGTHKVNVGIAGFIAEADAVGWELLPTVWCGAPPSAHVRQDAYETIAEMIVDGIAASGPIDGVYLDLHGAMVAEHVDDGEGELLRRVREVIGPDLPLVVSLDLHANVTKAMVQHADVLIAYRTYPHIDMADTGRGVAQKLRLLLNSKNPFAKAFRELPFLIPINWQCTDMEPCKRIYARLRATESDKVPSLSFAPGFPAADFPGCGPTVVAYGWTQAAADAAADEIAALVVANETVFDGPVFSPEEGVREAMAIAARATKPVVIADTQDNPGAGGNSDTMGMLRALVAAGAKKAAIGMIFDPEAAIAAHKAGQGKTVTLALGGKSNIPGDRPFEGDFLAETLSDGQFMATGPYFGRGASMNLGPSACLRTGDVRIVIASKKAQLADQAMFRYVGIEPTEQSILVNKSSVHFRADFEPIAETILICAAPGPMPADPSSLPWTRLRPGIRIKPNGPAFNAPKTGEGDRG
jgi:microcystin degradation protein MlrC